MRGRVYDPGIGRFMTADPVIQSPEWSQGLNRYAYVFNNPTNLVDPSGFIVQDYFSSAANGNTAEQITGFGAPIVVGGIIAAGVASSMAATAAVGASTAAAAGASTAASAAAASTASGAAVSVATAATQLSTMRHIPAPEPRMFAVPSVAPSAPSPANGSAAATAQNRAGILSPPPARGIPSACDVGTCLAQAGPGALPIPAPTPVAPPLPSAAQSQEIGEVFYRILEATNPIPLIESGLRRLGEILSLATPRDAQRLVNRRLGPGEITRIDKPDPRYPHTQWEAHSGGKGSPALQQDGTWKHLPKGKKPPFSRETLEWLEQHGWKLPQ